MHRLSVAAADHKREDRALTKRFCGSDSWLMPGLVLGPVISKALNMSHTRKR